MENFLLSKRSLIFSLGLSIIILLIIFFRLFFNNTTKIVFCDVGQGDSTYIRVNNNSDLLIDAGPNKSILQCLGKHLPFFDKKIEFAILTHFQKDHYGGFIEVLNHYKINYLLTLNTDDQDPAFITFKNKLKEKQVKIYYVTTQTKFKVNDALIKFIWPKDVKINKGKNDNSLIFYFENKGKKILFTGDASKSSLSNLINNLQANNTNVNNLLKTNILKIPHHGSKNGLSPIFLKISNPDISIISVGKNNSYGHPSNEVLKMLDDFGKKHIRTDIKGDIIFKIR